MALPLYGWSGRWRSLYSGIHRKCSPISLSGSKEETVPLVVTSFNISMLVEKHNIVLGLSGSGAGSGVGSGSGRMGSFPLSQEARRSNVAIMLGIISFFILFILLKIKIIVFIHRFFSSQFLLHPSNGYGKKEFHHGCCVTLIPACFKSADVFFPICTFNEEHRIS